jgi:pimeloyl-ACP methyl ester carboxylesterase
MIGRLLAAIAASLAVGCTQEVPRSVETSTGSLPIASLGSFYVGGSSAEVRQVPRLRASASGTTVEGQTSVHYFLPTRPVGPPIVLIPGGGLTTDTYLSTPDGRQGWAIGLLRAGFPVYLVDEANTARAGINGEPFNAVLRGEVAPASQQPLLVWAREQVWPRWGIGPEVGQPFPGSQFPIESADQLFAGMQMLPVNGAETTDERWLMPKVAGLLALLERIGPSVVLTHSLSGRTGFGAARVEPTRVRAIVTVEPVGCPTSDFQRLSSVPTLAIFGDFLDARPQIQARQEECRQLVDGLVSAGGSAELLDLPATGIRGNSHLIMLDRNSDAVLSSVTDWLRRHVQG